MLYKDTENGGYCIYMPHTVLRAFILDCKIPEMITIPRRVKETAEKDLGLYGKQEILDFIVNGGLRDARDYNVRQVGYLPERDAYSYGFPCYGKHGYISIHRNEADNGWVLKSLKYDTNYKQSLDQETNDRDKKRQLVKVL